MPKALSLKKVLLVYTKYLLAIIIKQKILKLLFYLQVQQTGPSKNQKSITQFFKNTTNADSKKPHTSADKIVPKNLVGPSFKRKASSPILVDEIDLVAETVAVVKKEQNTPKKLKTEALNGAFHTKVVKLKSPNKENGFSVVRSPQKQSERLNETSPNKKSPTLFYTRSPGNNEKELIQNPEASEISRSPLTPVSIDNIPENHGCDKTKDIEQKSFVKHLLFNGELAKSPLKKSPVKNQTEVQNHERKSTPKKSPFKGNYFYFIDLVLMVMKIRH